MAIPDFKNNVLQWAYAYGRPSVSGQIRMTAEDFVVEESISFEPSGQGEHVYLFIRKRGLNTVDVVKLIATLSGVDTGRISYAGMKDKNALTTQWFSIYITGFAEPEWETLNNENVTVLQIIRHNKKLKRGAIQKNRFSINICELQGPLESLESRLKQIQQHGVPNYFGEQRFGYDYNNLDRVESLAQGHQKIKNRHKRGIYYSAARSFVFNQVLSQRVSNHTWDTAITGEVVSLDRSRSFFQSEEITPELQQRMASHDIHPSGPMIGAGGTIVEHDALLLEQRCIQDYAHWEKWLHKERVASSRRALRLIPVDINWEFKNAATLQIEFELPSGTYATSVLREIIFCP